MALVKILVYIGIVLNVSDVRVRADMEGYIVGGDFAPIYNFPHSVYLSISCARQNSIDEFICAGSVLNQYFVLTAGHCLEDCGKNSKVIVSIGNEHIDRGVLSTAASCKIHERYDGFTMVNDIALVRLKTPIKFNKNVKRVAISRNPPYNEPAYVAGWGVVDDNKHIGTKRLKYVQQSLWSRDECAKMLRHVPVGTICGGLRNAQTNFAASGDSGGALVVRGFIQVGIVSYKVPKLSKSLVIYTEVRYFYDWIRSTTRNMFCMKSI